MSDTSPQNSDEARRLEIGRALGRIPSGLFILTSCHEDHRTGMLVSWVQQACFEPPMVSVAVAKGRPIMALISGSLRFGLCQLGDADKITLRRFVRGVEPPEDPFLGFELVRETVTGVPILRQSLSYLECKAACHVDVEGDHDIFVGLIVAGGFFEGDPQIHLRENGFRY